MPEVPVAHKWLASLIWMELSDEMVTRAHSPQPASLSLGWAIMHHDLRSFLPIYDFLDDGDIQALLCACSFITGYHWRPPVPKAMGKPFASYRSFLIQIVRDFCQWQTVYSPRSTLCAFQSFQVLVSQESAIKERCVSQEVAGPIGAGDRLTLAVDLCWQLAAACSQPRLEQPSPGRRSPHTFPAPRF